MKAALVQVVRDDIDVLFYNWLYYYNIGIRDYYIMLHLPDENTYSIVDKFEKKFSGVKLNIFTNTIDEHYHEREANILVNSAIADGINWIIAADADELLILKKHNLINDFLSQFDNSPVVLKFRWLDYRGDREVSDSENPFVEMKYSCINFMDADNTAWIKCCGYFNTDMKYIPGFHDITGCLDVYNVDSSVAYYAHFPDRNFEQYKKKILIQNKNWMNRYGYFYNSNITDEDIKKLWEERTVTDSGTRRVCKSDKYDNTRNLYYKYDPINGELFSL